MNAVLKELKRHGLLLTTDAKFPSVVRVIAGSGVVGSWWGHPKGRDIWRTTEELSDHQDALLVKLLDGKATFVHRDLWPALYGVVAGRQAWQMKGLSKQAAGLLRLIDKEGMVDSNKMSKDLVAGTAEIEERLLVQSEQVHTASGSHAKRMQRWDIWAKAKPFAETRMDPEDAQRRLEAVVSRMNGKCGARLRLPWQIGRASVSRARKTAVLSLLAMLSLFPAAKAEEMVSIPGGTFMMGCNEAVDAQCDINEKAYHSVRLSPFQIDKTEVTQAAYAACVEAGVCTMPKGNFTPQTKGEFPVTDVAWLQAASFCAWARKRLPSEAEWEFASRGTDGRIYPWGNTAPTCDRINMQGCGGQAAAAASYSLGASPFGVLNMSGNVWEWVNDWFENQYDPGPVENPAGPAEKIRRVARGGGFEGVSIRSSSRVGVDPPATYRALGIRCAK